MTAQAYVNSFPTFTGLDGLPLSSGYVYFGALNQDPRQYPKTVYFDAALTIVAPQPLRTTAGFLYRNGSPANVWADGSCSVLVLDSTQRQVFYLADSSGIIGNVAAAAAAAAAPYVAAASASAVASAASAAQAASYAAAAATGAKFFDTIALGNAGVANAATFGVKAGGTDGLLRPSIYRRESAGVSTFLYAVLPAAEFDAAIVQETLLSYSFSIRDYLGRAAFGIQTDGTVAVNALQATTFNGVATDWASTVGALSTVVGVVPLMAINDPYGRTAQEIYADGTVGFAALQVPVVNNFDVRKTLRPTSFGTFDAEVVFFIDTGQSLSLGPVPAITTAQEYDNVGFPPGSTSPGAFVTLTSANCSTDGTEEPPMFGALGNIKALLAAEKNLQYTGMNYQLVGASNAHGSYSITALNKGTALYAAGISQATSAKTLATAANKTMAAGAVFYTQGEADSAMALATYQALLQQLASDYNTDLKAATGQTKDIAFICYQTCSILANRNIALAQLAASNASSLIHMACPMYQFDYLDFQHVVAESSKWLGAYYGLVYERIAVDGVTWSPLQPLSNTRSGKFVNVKFNVMVKPLVLDTATPQVPAQTNYGFTLVDSGGTDIPITSVSVSSPDTVKIVANANIPAGAKLRYGFNAATGKGAYTGGCGNLRDSQGDTVTYRGHRLDNWCVIFEFALA